MKNTSFNIANRKIGPGQPCYIIAEVSCNHAGDFSEARRIIEAAAKSGADAAKLQTYTADTITRKFSNDLKGTMWEGMDLYKLYQKAYTPWEWYPELKKVADDCGLHLFSSPFDETAVDFLMEQDVPAIKIASYEIVDTKLLEYVAKTGKPVIISNGMTDFLELKEAVDALRLNGCANLAVLHCNSGYPARFEELNLATIKAIQDIFQVPSGLSDHTVYADADLHKQPMAHVAPIEATKNGANIIELHLMTSRAEGKAMFEKKTGGYDWAFSKEPDELKKTIDAIRHFEQTGNHEYESESERGIAALCAGTVCFEPTAKELGSRAGRPCLWAVEDIKAGEKLHFAGGKSGNIDSIRPGGGLHIRYADYIHGQIAIKDIKAGTPLSWDMLERRKA